MQSMLSDIGSLSGTRSRPDKFILAKVLGTFATDSPTLSYLPYGLAQSLLTFLAADIVDEGFDSDQDAFELEAPLLNEFCLVLDRLHDFCNSGQAVHSRYSDFFRVLAERSVRCGTGGPSAPACDTLEDQPSSRTNKCLTSGVCAGVKQVRDRMRYTMDSNVDHWEGCRHAFVNGSRGSQRTGGIFTWFCKHGVCYCFYIIPNAEGRDEAFIVFVQVFSCGP